MNFEPASPPRRGLLDRPIVPTDLERELAGRFGFEEIQPLTELGGSSTLNLLVRTTDGPSVVRVYRDWMTQERLEAMQAARRYLAEAGVPCLSPTKALDGTTWFEIDGHLIEVEPYIEYDCKMDTWERLEQGMPLLARLHDRLASLHVPEAGRHAPAANSILRESFLEGVLAGTASLRAIGPPDNERAVADLADELAARISAMERWLDPGPLQLVHGDYWDNNVYFRDGRIVLVLDFDFMAVRPRIDDLALTLYYTNSTFSEDQVSDGRIRRLGHLVRAYDSALTHPLSDDEWQAIPLAMARTAVGFFAHFPYADSEEGMHALALELAPDFVWVSALLDDLERWQEVLRQPDV